MNKHFTLDSQALGLYSVGFGCRDILNKVS